VRHGGEALNTERSEEGGWAHTKPRRQARLFFDIKPEGRETERANDTYVENHGKKKKGQTKDEWTTGNRKKFRKNWGKANGVRP